MNFYGSEVQLEYLRLGMGPLKFKIKNINLLIVLFYWINIGHCMFKGLLLIDVMSLKKKASKYVSNAYWQNIHQNIYNGRIKLSKTLK